MLQAMRPVGTVYAFPLVQQLWWERGTAAVLGFLRSTPTLIWSSALKGVHMLMFIDYLLSQVW
jgi:hypothetical protein